MSRPVRFFPIYATRNGDVFAEPSREIKREQECAPSACSNPDLGLGNGESCKRIATVRVQILTQYAGKLNTCAMWNLYIIAQDLCMSCTQLHFPRVFPTKIKELQKMKENKMLFCNNCDWDEYVKKGEKAPSSKCEDHNLVMENVVSWVLE